MKKLLSLIIAVITFMVARMTFCQRNIKKTFPRPVRLSVRLIIIIGVTA